MSLWITTVRSVELKSSAARMEIVTDVGPRISFFGRQRNLLWWDDDAARGDWRLYGGHRIWTTRPGADESEEAYAPDNAKCAVRKTANGVIVTAPGLLQKKLTVRILEARQFLVTATLTNTGNLLWSGGLWCITCTKSKRVEIPLGDGSEWDVVSMSIARKWAGHTSRLNDPQFRLTENALIVTPDGHEAKRFVHAPQGIMNGNFSKRVTYVPGQYPHNANLAVYLSPAKMVELETMSPMRTLAPGERMTHNELWVI